MSLAHFIASENMMEKFFSKMADAAAGPKYPEDPDMLLPRHKEELALRLASALSPEALTCDGELRGAKLRAKAARLHKAKAELEALGQVVPEY